MMTFANDSLTPPDIDAEATAAALGYLAPADLLADVRADLAEAESILHSAARSRGPADGPHRAWPWYWATCRRAARAGKVLAYLEGRPGAAPPDLGNESVRAEAEARFVDVVSGYYGSDSYRESLRRVEGVRRATLNRVNWLNSQAENAGRKLFAARLDALACLLVERGALQARLAVLAAVPEAAARALGAAAAAAIDHAGGAETLANDVAQSRLVAAKPDEVIGRIATDLAEIRNSLARLGPDPRGTLAVNLKSQAIDLEARAAERSEALRDQAKAEARALVDRAIAGDPAAVATLGGHARGGFRDGLAAAPGVALRAIAAAVVDSFANPTP